MLLFNIDWMEALEVLLSILVAFALALPLGWSRERSSLGVGLRTLPIVAMAACGFALLARLDHDGDANSRARVLQGIIAGIGFIGGGAILKGEMGIRGLVTAASVWNTAAIGVAVGYGRLEIAILLCVVNLGALAFLGPVSGRGD